MAPNIRVEHVIRNHGDEDHDDDESFADAAVITSYHRNDIYRRSFARTLWQNRQLSQQGVDLLVSSDHDHHHDDPLVEQALSSIRLLDSPENNQTWLNSYKGELYSISHDLLRKVTCQAPHEFAARVADSNENLFYEMQTRKGLAHLGLQGIYDVVQAEEYLGSFLTTDVTVPQPAHVDYTWEVLEDDHGSTLSLGFFPLTEEGMFLQVWPRNDEIQEIQGELVFIPLGRLLVLPASTIHGGGFRTTPYYKKNDQGQARGNLRFHLYMARGNKGSRLPTHQTNKYTEPYDKRRELCERYVNTCYMEQLQRYLFL